jgi:hypothetical protein
MPSSLLLVHDVRYDSKYRLVRPACVVLLLIDGTFLDKSY